MGHALPAYPVRVGLLCLVLLLGWALVVPSWATSAQVPASAGRFRLWHDLVFRLVSCAILVHTHLREAAACVVSCAVS
jgi:hypothetical protein